MSYEIITQDNVPHFEVTTRISLKTVRAIVEEAGSRNKITAIRMLRDAYGIASLRDAKEIVEYALEHPGMSAQEREQLEWCIDDAQKHIASMRQRVESFHDSILESESDIQHWTNQLHQGEKTSEWRTYESLAGKDIR
jgi:hypothetical protein